MEYIQRVARIQSQIIKKIRHVRTIRREIRWYKDRRIDRQTDGRERTERERERMMDRQTGRLGRREANQAASSLLCSGTESCPSPGTATCSDFVGNPLPPF